MSSNKKLIGATLAATAALALAAAPVTSALANTAKNGVPCYGINSCKGKSACKTANNACKGHNRCKGQGAVMEKSAKACEKAGGKTSM